MQTNQPDPTEYGPADYERLYLPKLEAQNQDALSYVAQMQACWTKDRPLSPQEIMLVLNYLQAADQNFLTYEPWAQYLKQAGLPQMSVRLEQIRADIQSAVGIYSQMYQSAVNYQNQMAQMQAQIDSQWTQTIMQANIHRQREFDRSIQMHDLVLYRGYP